MVEVEVDETQNGPLLVVPRSTDRLPRTSRPRLAPRPSTQVELPVSLPAFVVVKGRGSHSPELRRPVDPDSSLSPCLGSSPETSPI